jgi:hypothetical protein
MKTVLLFLLVLIASAATAQACPIGFRPCPQNLALCCR